VFSKGLIELSFRDIHMRGLKGIKEIGMGRTEDKNIFAVCGMRCTIMQVLDWWSNAFHTFCSSMPSPIMRIAKIVSMGAIK
jgi:hypothetical protein